MPTIMAQQDTKKVESKSKPLQLKPIIG